MENQDVDQSQVEVSNDPMERMMNLLGGPDDGESPEEEDIADEDQAEDSDVEAEAETDDAGEVEEPEYEEIQWNGEVKKLTKAEMRDLAQQGFDYTKKTQELAEQRREFEAQAQAVQQSIALQNQQIEVIAQVKAIDSQLEQYKQVNWMQLAESDPVEYLKLQEQYRSIKEVRESVVSQFQAQAQQLQAMQTQQMQASLAREAEILSNVLPEFRGEKAKESQAKVRAYLAELGFNENEISSVGDHRMVRVAWEAAQWRALQAAKPQTAKKVAEVPKVVKAGVVKAKSQNTQKQEQLRQGLRKTGNQDYAAKLIESML